jgi:hypothetical protein
MLSKGTCAVTAANHQSWVFWPQASIFSLKYQPTGTALFPVVLVSTSNLIAYALEQEFLNWNPPSSHPVWNLPLKCWLWNYTPTMRVPEIELA